MLLFRLTSASYALLAAGWQLSELYVSVPSSVDGHKPMNHSDACDRGSQAADVEEGSMVQLRQLALRRTEDAPPAGSPRAATADGNKDALVKIQRILASRPSVSHAADNHTLVATAAQNARKIVRTFREHRWLALCLGLLTPLLLVLVRVDGLMLCMIAMLVFGVVSITLKDAMANLEVQTESGKFHAFDYPVLWTLLSMAGMALCWPAHIVQQRRRAVADRESPLAAAPWRAYVVIFALHWSSLLCVNIVFQYLPGSFPHTMRGVKLALICVTAEHLLGRPQKGHQVAGALVALVGVLLVAVSAASLGTTRTERPSISVTQVVVSVCLCLLAESVRGILLLYQEKVMQQYSIPALRLVGTVGLMGIPFSVLVLILVNKFHTESTIDAIYQLRHSTPLVMLVGTFVPVITLFELMGYMITSGGSALLRTLLELLRLPIIWVIELYMGWLPFQGLQALGLALVTAGFLVERSIIKVPGLKQ